VGDPVSSRVLGDQVTECTGQVSQPDGRRVCDGACAGSRLDLVPPARRWRLNRQADSR